MRTWYDCSGTHPCPQQAHSIGAEWPEWSGRESDRDRWGEIIEVRRIDSSLNVRVCGRRWEAETESGKEMDAESKWVSQSIKSTMHSLPLLSVHPSLPPSSRCIYKTLLALAAASRNHPERYTSSNQLYFMQRRQSLSKSHWHVSRLWGICLGQNKTWNTWANRKGKEYLFKQLISIQPGST